MTEESHNCIHKSSPLLHQPFITEQIIPIKSNSPHQMFQKKKKKLQEKIFFHFTLHRHFQIFLTLLMTCESIASRRQRMIGRRRPQAPRPWVQLLSSRRAPQVQVPGRSSIQQQEWHSQMRRRLGWQRLSSSCPWWGGEGSNSDGEYNLIWPVCRSWMR